MKAKPKPVPAPEPFADELCRWLVGRFEEARGRLKELETAAVRDDDRQLWIDLFIDYASGIEEALRTAIMLRQRGLKRQVWNHRSNETHATGALIIDGTLYATVPPFPDADDFAPTVVIVPIESVVTLAAKGGS